MAKYRRLKEDVIRLHNEGLSDWEICKRLDCGLGSCYQHLKPGHKEKATQRRHRDKDKPLYIIGRKVAKFNRPVKIKKDRQPKNSDYHLFQIKAHYFGYGSKMQITPAQVAEKYGTETACYLTGQPIDLTKPRTYQFDHKIPKTRGGESSIDNLGICTRQANASKSDMTPEEYIALCQQVLLHHGYQVTQPLPLYEPVI